LDTLIKPEVLGAAKVRAQFPAAVTIFLAPPSQEEAIRRVVARQSETEADLAARVAVMQREFGAAKDYDYIVINRTGHLEDAVAEVRRIIEIERQRRLPA
jgi:guanylate kinase